MKALRNRRLYKFKGLRYKHLRKSYGATMVWYRKEVARYNAMIRWLAQQYVFQTTFYASDADQIEKAIADLISRAEKAVENHII